MFRQAAPLAMAGLLALTGCGSREEGPLTLTFIASEEELFAGGQKLSEPAQHVRAAQALGLVTRDERGEIIPGLADRWIVTDDGRGFIFRLRDGDWPDGTPLTAQSAKAALTTAMRGLEGTSMALDLAPVEEVRAMAGRVIELRLSGPFPALLQLLAQPELALEPGEGTGDMTIRRQGRAALLALKPPTERGLPEVDNWQEGLRPIRILALSAPEALAMFEAGDADAVLGGTIDSLPLVDTGPLSRGTVRIDPAFGLFGLVVTSASGPLGDPEIREALAMAIDRQALIAPLGVGGWVPTTRVVNPGIDDDPGYVGERWSGRSIDDLRAEAASRFARWRGGQDESETKAEIVITLAIERGPGLDILFRELASQFSQIGIALERVDAGQRAHLALVDRIARYSSPRWFLDQFNCTIARAVCSEDLDYLVELSAEEPDLGARATLLAEAEAELTLSNVYIPFGQPLRWSLVRGDLEGFVPNQWAFHPLPPMAEMTR